jgi:hypothetical protein
MASLFFIGIFLAVLCLFILMDRAFKYPMHPHEFAGRHGPMIYSRGKIMPGRPVVAKSEPDYCKNCGSPLEGDLCRRCGSLKEK